MDSDSIMTEDEVKSAQSVLTGKQIVIADDNGGILKWLKFTLQDYGATVNVFKHGQEAIDFVTNEAVADVLILDLIMNNLGGVDIVKAIRPKQNPFVMFITGCSPDKIQYLEAEKLGMVIQKPVGVFRIIKEIITAFKKKDDK